MSDLKSAAPFRPGAVTQFRAPRRTRLELVCEALESRQLLSTTAALTSTPDLSQIAAQQNLQVLTRVASTPAGYTPQQIQNAYGVNQITFSGGTVAGNGAGQTIAIVDAYNDPNIQANLNMFDTQFGLPATTVTRVNEYGGTSLPASDPTGGWELEESLDVEWAHAVAPKANIVLVEASSDSLSDLFDAVNTARDRPGVSVVSMSWGTTEFWGESSYDSLFTTPPEHTDVTFVAASGDSGAWYGPMYPSVSPNVLAVGGTTLTLAAGSTYGSETGWSDSTGGFSGLDSNWWTYESEPSYQTATLQAVGLSYGVRTSPDVSFNADPNTGVAVYDSVPYSGQSGWFQVGGTSAATPAWAGLVAIADQGLATGKKGALSNTQAQTDLYALPSSDFHDITTGFNGYSATPGYDLVTGLGSPKANLVIAGILNANGVSEGSATTPVTGAAPTHLVRATTSRFDVTSSSTSGTGSSSGASSIAGLSSTGLAGITTTSGTFGVQALVTQVSSTQAQPATQQATVVTPVNQSTAASPSLGQSLPQQPQNLSPSLAIDETTEPKWLIEDARAVPSPAAAQQTAPAPDQKAAPAPGQMPADAAPALPQAPAPDEPVDDPATSLFDEALARISLSMAARRLEVPSGPTSDMEQATETLSDRSVSTLAGAAALAVGGYRVLLGRSDRIKRRWTPGRFM
ncbi:MAG: S53 family peptidase [Isosphaeraceae bacterium]